MYVFNLIRTDRVEMSKGVVAMIIMICDALELVTLLRFTQKNDDDDEIKAPTCESDVEYLSKHVRTKHAQAI